MAPSSFGWIFGLNAAGLIIASQVNARLLRRYRSERVLRGALASNKLFGAAMLALVATGTGGIWGVAVPLFGAISGLGFSFPNSTAATMAPFGDRAGMAAALLGTLQFTHRRPAIAYRYAVWMAAPPPPGPSLTASG